MVYRHMVPVAARSKAYVLAAWLVDLVGSNPARGMDVCLYVSVLCCPV
jgi:hypothetical protein